MTEGKNLWGGRFTGSANPSFAKFNNSFAFDRRLFEVDIRASVAHCNGLVSAGVLSREEGDRINGGLQTVLNRGHAGSGYFDEISSEDIHSFVETRLVETIGDAGRKLHTGRSRNDQVATDLRLWLREAIDQLLSQARSTQEALLDFAEVIPGAVLPGYTHLQRAQPILLAHWCLAYFEMLVRDCDRLEGTRKRVNVLPLGSAALAGTSFPIDREAVATELGFDSVSRNSVDDSMELVRGKAGRVFAHNVSLLTMLKGLPLAYNKDMQEDKEAVFDSFDTTQACLEVSALVLRNTTLNEERMRVAASQGMMNATELADYLVRKGVTFREAHEMVGRIVVRAIERDVELGELSLDDLRSFSSEIENDVYAALTLEKTLATKSVAGGTAPERVAKALAAARKSLKG